MGADDWKEQSMIGSLGFSVPTSLERGEGLKVELMINHAM